MEAILSFYLCVSAWYRTPMALEDLGDKNPIEFMPNYLGS